MSVPPIVTQYGGPQPYKLNNVNTNINVFNSEFYPNQIADLAIWLDGTDILNGSNPADGTPIVNWSNKASNSISVRQTNATYQPVYNSARNSVVFSNDNNNICLPSLEEHRLLLLRLLCPSPLLISSLNLKQLLGE